MHLILAMLYFYQLIIVKGKTLSLKENIEAVKKELSAEEQFLESIVKAEGFWKKYKKLLIALAVLVVVAALGMALYNTMKEQSLKASNEAYLTLQKNPTDKEALETLKSKNPKLYQLFLFSNEMKSADVAKLEALSSQISDPILKDLLSYQKASLSGKGLSSYAMKQDALLKEFASLQEAYNLFKEGKSKEAKTLLAQIPESSQLQQIAQSFKHYLK
ncbi:MAG TPA: tetratricopeptide repeat protein [Campylobacterales bacterium]|nr:tetratricopeptide repeat protein [Campylobacterales bacterium]